MLAACKRALKQLTSAAQGMSEAEAWSKLVVYFSDQAHSCVFKACQVWWISWHRGTHRKYFQSQFCRIALLLQHVRCVLSGIETTDQSLMVSCLHLIESDWFSFIFFWGLHNVQVAGIATGNFRSLPTDASTNFALSPAVVRKAIATDVVAGLIPFFLCGSVLINLKAPVILFSPIFLISKSDSNIICLVCVLLHQ